MSPASLVFLALDADLLITLTHLQRSDGGPDIATKGQNPGAAVQQQVRRPIVSSSRALASPR